MWAQLIEMRLKPGEDTAALIAQIRAAEQPGSGLVRSLMMRDQADPGRVFSLVLFENEEMARAREQDPRRQQALQAARATMEAIFDGPLGFTDLMVIDEWEGATT